jgi:hypothetical protein
MRCRFAPVNLQVLPLRVKVLAEECVEKLACDRAGIGSTSEGPLLALPACAARSCTAL